MPPALTVFGSFVGYAIAGMLLLWLGYRVFDRLTPGDMHAKIFDEGNLAVAIVAAGYLLALAIIVAASLVS